VDVVDDQHVRVPVPGAEGLEGLLLDRVDVAVDEVLARQIEDLRGGLALQDRVADRLEEMGLPQADAAVDEERVVEGRGFSLTATAAAKAIRLDGPSMKLSNV
jgi:hypothetical protein